jgi:nicotinamide-nucleotide amidase
LKAEILSVGTELLMGQIANTNAQYISRRLPEVGIGVFYHSVVGDNPARLKESLQLALSRADVIITTGGLGPTQDDLTKDTVAGTLGLKMQLHRKSFEAIKAYFQGNGKVMVESNFRQAYFPEGSIIMENDMGTAPGCIIPVGDSQFVVMLPGPPKELHPMFDRCVLPFFAQKAEIPLLSRFVRVVGVGESLVEEKIISLVEGQTNPTFATYAKDGIVTIRITAEDDEGQGNALLDKAEAQIRDILGDAVYTSSDEELEEVVMKLLKEKGMTIACAESCTGGQLAQMITSHSGASDVFATGVVTYSEESKMKLLGVSADTLRKYTVYSPQVAEEMAEGLQRLSGADVCVSITGIAGPGGGTAETPVGTVFIGVKCGEKLSVTEHHFTGGNRDRVRTLSVVHALNLVRKELI